MEIWFCVRFIVLAFYRVLKIVDGIVHLSSAVMFHKWNALSWWRLLIDMELTKRWYIFTILMLYSNEAKIERLKRVLRELIFLHWILTRLNLNCIVKKVNVWETKKKGFLRNENVFTFIIMNWIKCYCFLPRHEVLSCDSWCDGIEDSFVGLILWLILFSWNFTVKTLWNFDENL